MKSWYRPQSAAERRIAVPSPAGVGSRTGGTKRTHACGGAVGYGAEARYRVLRGARVGRRPGSASARAMSRTKYEPSSPACGSSRRPMTTASTSTSPTTWPLSRCPALPPWCGSAQTSPSGLRGGRPGRVRACAGCGDTNVADAAAQCAGGREVLRDDCVTCQGCDLHGVPLRVPGGAGMPSGFVTEQVPDPEGAHVLGGRAGAGLIGREPARAGDSVVRILILVVMKVVVEPNQHCLQATRNQPPPGQPPRRLASPSTHSHRSGAGTITPRKAYKASTPGGGHDSFTCLSRTRIGVPNYRSMPFSVRSPWRHWCSKIEN